MYPMPLFPKLNINSRCKTCNQKWGIGEIYIDLMLGKN